MKLGKLFLVVCLIFQYASTFAQSKMDEGFMFSSQPDKKQVDLFYNGKLLTAYCYYDSVMKPVLFPVNSVSGVTVTRGYPLEPRPGERNDHPHHVGMWLNYENINGLDFWNASTARAYAIRSKYGTIDHEGIPKMKADKNEATLEVAAQWKRHDKAALMAEATTYVFRVAGNDFVIDRTTTLRAIQEDVNFKDAKDGLFAIRVARELELPSNEKVTLIAADGKTALEPAVNNEHVSGTYLSSEGLKGDAVWGTRARWVTLSGNVKNKPVSLTIIDHPKNAGYPAYWHARGYGLFAINPLGQEVFSKGKEKMNFVLKKDESVTFRYRIVIHEGVELKPSEIEVLVKSFEKF